MTPRELADQAQQLLDNSFYKYTCAHVRADVVHQLETSAQSEVQELTLMLKCLRLVQAQLERYVQDGSIEEKKQEQQEWIDRVRQRLPKWRK